MSGLLRLHEVKATDLTSYLWIIVAILVLIHTDITHLYITLRECDCWPVLERIV